MSIPVIQGNQGKLNLDNEPVYVTQGDYLDAKDVRFFTSEGQTTGSHENIDGNKFSFDIGSVSARSKKYRVDGISAISGTATGWDSFGAPDSELFTNQQSFDPCIIEDISDPSSLYMTTGMNVWNYDVALNTWTEMFSMLIDSTPSYSSAKIAMDPVTNNIACVYLKDFGSGLRYVVKEWTGAAWVSRTGSQGFEVAQGYTFGTYLGYNYGAYYDARVFYDNSGGLYLYAVCVHSDNTQPTTSPFYNNLRIPRVFKYNTGTSVWDDISGLSSSWAVPVEESWGDVIQYWTQDIRFNIGDPKQVGTSIYFPLCYAYNISTQPNFYNVEPLIAAYDTVAGTWSMFMDQSNALYSASGRVTLAQTPVVTGTFSPNNLKSWAEPSIAIDSSSEMYLTYGVSPYTNNVGELFLFKETGGVWSNEITPLNLPSLSTSFSYSKGRVTMAIDASGSVIGGSADDVYIAVRDSQQSNKLTVLKYASSALSFIDVQAISSASLDEQGSNIFIDSGGTLYVCFSDYANASSYSVPIGIPTVYLYVGGGSPNTDDFDFFYTNGIQIGTVSNINTVSGFISGLNSLFSAPQYSVTTNVIQGTSGYSVEFTVDPLDQNSVSVLGFDYTVSNSGPFQVVLIEEPLSSQDSGPLNIIGRSDLLDNLFILSTPNKRLVENGADVNVIVYSVGPNGLDLFIDKSEDLSSYGYVSLSNDSSVTEFTGTHVISVDSISDPSYDIVTLVGYFPTITPTQNIRIRGIVIGHGNIGVAIKDEETQVWSYTRLIGSNEFAFSTQKQADVISEQNNRGYSIYFTDNNSPLRSFNYYGDFVQDGALSYINSENAYVLGRVGARLALQKSYAGSTIDYAGQGIGRLKCGNYRYSVRFITKEGVATNWSLQSNPFSVYGTQQDPYKITGGGPEEDSGKSNIIDVSWSSLDSYDFIEFAYTRVLPGAISATGLVTNETKKFGRTKLNAGQQSIRYEHDGYELDESDYVSEELQKVPFIIKRAKNIRSIDNRLVVSNVVSGSNEDDLINVFSGITYEIDKYAMPITGCHQPEASILERDGPNAGDTNSYTQKPLVVGEYMDPENVFKYIGYMQDETYRFYAVAEYYTGEFSDAYYLFDVKFDTNQTSDDLKRQGSFSDYKLNDGYSGACLIDGANVYVPYVKINIPPILPEINGVPAKDIIKRIHIFRADVLNKTVLSNGLGVLTVGNGSYGYNPFVGSPSNDLYRYGPVVTTNNYHYSFPFIADVNNTTANEIQTILDAAGYYGINTIVGLDGPSVVRRDIVEFYSQDHVLSSERINYNAGDKIINYGHYDNYFQSYSDDSSYSNHHQFGSFYFNVPSGSAPSSSDSEIIAFDTSAFSGPISWLNAGGGVRFGTGSNEFFVKGTAARWGLPDRRDLMVQNSGYVFFLDSNVTSFGINPAKTGVDFGCHMISYYRDLTPDQQYGNKSIGSAIPTGAFYDLETDTTQLGAPVSPNTIQVFGGDTFTCKSLLKYRYTDPANSPDGGRFCVGIEFYSQSRVNPQLRYNEFGDDPAKTNFVWPFDFINPSEPSEFQKWFNNSLGTFIADFDEKIAYNESFSDRNRINVKAVYDPDVYYETKLPATIFYSDPKLQESVSDSYAYIDPTNRKDLDITLGPINHHEIFNGELITFQDRAVVRQFFNTTAMLADANSQIILGDGGAVLSRKGATLSTYGAINKWGVIKGKSQGGNDVLYWFDAISKKIFRIGADGIVPISTRGNIDSYLAENTNLVQVYDMPAHGFGVHGVWDESNNEVVITFRVRRNIEEWVNGRRYLQGEIVFYNGSPEFYDWHQTGEIYISNQDSNIFVPSESFGAWTHIPHTNTDYYNEFTIVYSEDKNGFTTFYSPKPKIYLPYKDRYLSPRPIFPESYVYEHNFGEPCVWYPMDQNNPVSDPTALRTQAYIEGVVNYNPELIKTAEAISIDCDIQPLLVEVRSKDHDTFMNSSDFVLAETMYRSPIKNDTQNGAATPDSDTSRLYGRWFGVKFFMDFGVKQKMRSFVSKLRARNRMYNK
jgi:hypothetical protein